MIKNLSFCIFLLLILYVVPSIAQNETTQIPLEITADQSLEWYRAEQKLIARGNALAKQGDASIAAQTLTAFYHNGANDRFEITQIIAENDVVIQSDNNQAFGDKAVYTLKGSLAVMTGEDLNMQSPDQSVVAQDRFEYHIDAGKLIAIGNAIATRPNQEGGVDTLAAQTLTAQFTNDQNGKRALQTLEAQDNVVITTSEERVTGHYGIYRKATNTAEILGSVSQNVKITRGPNTLEGARATVNLTTQKSQIFASSSTTPHSQGRVKAVFFPDSN